MALIKEKETLNVFRLLRIARNKKVKDIAKELSITPAYVHAIENGEKYPSDRLLRDYAAALGVNVEIIENFKKGEKKDTRFENTLLRLLHIICEFDSKKSM